LGGDEVDRRVAAFDAGARREGKRRGVDRTLRLSLTTSGDSGFRSGS